MKVHPRPRDRQSGRAARQLHRDKPERRGSAHHHPRATARDARRQARLQGPARRNRGRGVCRRPLRHLDRQPLPRRARPDHRRQPILDWLVELHARAAEPPPQRATGNRQRLQVRSAARGLRQRFGEALRHDARLKALWEGKPPSGHDRSRSAWDFALANRMRKYGRDPRLMGAIGDRLNFEDFAAIAPTWGYGKGHQGDARHWRRSWDRVNQPPEPEEPAAEPMRPANASNHVGQPGCGSLISPPA